MTRPDSLQIASWVEQYREKLQRGELCSLSSSPEPSPSPSEWPAEWPERFISLALHLNLSRYLSELAKLERGELRANRFYGQAQEAWKTRDASDGGMILMGGEGAGKSVTALRMALSASEGGSGWDFLDAGEFADLWAKQDWTRIGQLKTVGLLVIDEIGDCEDIKGSAFGLMKRIINHRYRNSLPTILATTQNEADLRAAVSHEVVDRFPRHLRIGTSEGSNRP